MNVKCLMAGLTAIVFVALAWTCRWETLHAGKETAYLMNRWTGEIRWLVGTEWHPVNQVAPPITGPFGSNDPLAK